MYYKYTSPLRNCGLHFPPRILCCVTAQYQGDGTYVLRTTGGTSLAHRYEQLNHTQTNVIVPDAHGDWLNQRGDSFSRFIEIGNKKNQCSALFKLYSSGLKTARDAWVYGSCRDRLRENVDRMFETYNQQAKDFDSDSSKFEFIRDDKLIHWNRTLENFFKRGVRNLSFDPYSLYRSIYRPFYPQHCYFNKYANDMTYQLPLLFCCSQQMKWRIWLYVHLG